MDVLISGPQHLKIFTLAIQALHKVGKDLDIEFDPLTGLALRTISEAKSAYAEFQFEVGFFEQCLSVPGCRRSCGVRDDTDQGTVRGGTHIRRRRRRKSQSISRGGTEDENDNEDQENDTNAETQDQENYTNADNEEGPNYKCRVPIHVITKILRARKGVLIQTLRIRSVDETYTKPNHPNKLLPADGAAADVEQMKNYQHDDGKDGTKHKELRMRLSFEFDVISQWKERISKVNDTVDGSGMPTTSDNSSERGGIMRFVHIIGANDAELFRVKSSKEDCSEIISHPKVLLQMLEPLTNNNEVALTINDGVKVVSATSFHPTDVDPAIAQNAYLNARTGTRLKTETSIGCDDFYEFHWMDDRELMNDDEEHKFPVNVNEEVTLVFPIKAAKAMLQFTSQSNFDIEKNPQIIISFHWGGHPIVFETKGDTFSGEFILATLDHRLLGSMPTSLAVVKELHHKQQDEDKPS